MNNRNNNPRNLNKFILVLFVLFFAILLQDATTGTLSSAWVPLALVGATILGLPLLAMLFSHKKGGDILNER
jgi:hypothetical protein